MSDNQNQPREFDAVLGGQALPPPSLVLGGLEGVKRRLTSSVIEVQVAALSDALSYGEAGLELVIQALPNSSEQLQRVASLLLREKGGDIGKQALLDYDPWLFFTTLQDWTKDELYSRGTTYAVKITKQLQNFVRNSQVKNLEALVCEIEDSNSYNFQAFVNILAEAHKDLPNLKALFIGDSKDSKQWRQGCSQIYLHNIYPILKAFPYLEVLHLCGRIGQPDNPLLKDIHKEVLLQIRNPDGSVIERKKLKPNNLKTLIVEGADLKDNHLTQICEIEYPSLEYLELWLGKQALLKYDPWTFFTTFQDWKVEHFNPQIGITDPVGTAYIVNIEQLKLLLQDPQASTVRVKQGIR